MIQQKWPQEFARAKDLSRAAHANILIMLYPTQESFLASVDQDDTRAPWVQEAWNEDIVIALRGPCEDDQLDELLEFAGTILRDWTPRPLSAGRGELNLA